PRRGVAVGRGGWRAPGRSRPRFANDGRARTPAARSSRAQATRLAKFRWRPTLGRGLTEGGELLANRGELRGPTGRGRRAHRRPHVGSRSHRERGASRRPGSSADRRGVGGEFVVGPDVGPLPQGWLRAFAARRSGAGPGGVSAAGERAPAFARRDKGGALRLELPVGDGSKVLGPNSPTRLRGGRAFGAARRSRVTHLGSPSHRAARFGLRTRRSRS